MSKKIHLPDAKDEIARPRKMRDINRQIVLNYIRDRSPISRADIARRTELQRSTISSIVDSLISSGRVEEIGEGTSTGGRKPQMLQIKRGVPAAIGVDVMPRKTVIALSDLSGKVMSRSSFNTRSDVDSLTNRIISEIRSIVTEHPASELEVGISLPGICDSRSGVARYIPSFGWRDWKIAESVRAGTGLEATIDNDANAIALAELWFGGRRKDKLRNFITVLIGDGVGTGIIFDGQVYRGENGEAGEFGHMIVGSSGPVECACGSSDCWEAYASDRALKERFKSGAGSEVSADEIVGLAQSGDQKAVVALKETARYLGIGISNLIVGFSPQSVIVSGKITRAWDLVSDEIHGTVEASIRRKLSRTTVRQSQLGSSPTLKGAISLVLARRFSSAT